MHSETPLFLPSKTKGVTQIIRLHFKNVVEEVAYTWFNRLDCCSLYGGQRLFALPCSCLPKTLPKQSLILLQILFNTDLDFTDNERDYILKAKDENKLDELFRMLFIKQCNKLNDILPELFEKTDDYSSELLLTISFTDKDGVVYHLTHDIEEGDFTEQVQIIGWLYQYYNSEPKDKVLRH